MRHFCGTEFRAEGRRLIGPAIRYGDISPSHRERFEPGAFQLDGTTRWLDVRHNADQVIAWTGGGGLELKDTRDALMVTAELPRIPLADKALVEVRAGKLRGFSIEFNPKRERREGGLRVIQRADLAGIGVVEFPSYPASTVEARGRSGLTMQASIPADTDLACECSGPGCEFARFATEALQGAVDDALDQVKRTRDTVAAFNTYARPVASTNKGTLRGHMDGKGMVIEIDLPDSDAGRAMIAANEDAGVVVRPFLDAAKSEGVEIPREGGGNAMAYSKMHLRALIVSATDKREGWPAPTLVTTDDKKRSARIVRPRHGRFPRWL